MIKETLTMENIKSDLRKRILYDLSFELNWAILALATYLILFGFICLCTSSNSFKLVFTIIFFGIFLLFVIGILTATVIGFTAIKKGNITIVSDWVTGTKDYRYRQNPAVRPYVFALIFARSGIYKIPIGENYSWSTQHNCQDPVIYELAGINDDFYVVHIGHRKNVIAYSKKLFALENEQA